MLIHFCVPIFYILTVILGLVCILVIMAMVLGVDQQRAEINEQVDVLT